MSGTFFRAMLFTIFEHKSFTRWCSDVCKLW